MSTGLGVRGLYSGLSEAPRCVLCPSHLTSLGSAYLLENQGVSLKYPSGRQRQEWRGSLQFAASLFCECSQFQAKGGGSETLSQNTKPKAPPTPKKQQKPPLESCPADKPICSMILEKHGFSATTRSCHNVGIHLFFFFFFCHERPLATIQSLFRLHTSSNTFHKV